MAGSLQIIGGRVIDPAQNIDRVANLLVRDGTVVGLDLPIAPDVPQLDANGKIVVPGLIDMHAELREPGFEEDETIATGTAAALAGGFTTVACLPNTDPVVDSRASVEFIQHQAERAHHCHVVVIACISRGRTGEQLAEIGSLVAAGAVGFSDAPQPVQSAELMRRALQYCQMFNRPVLNRPEVLDLTRNGIMHEGWVSTLLGLPGMPAEAEDVMTARDLCLAESTGGRLHLLDISSGGSVDLIRRAKARGAQVTASICPAQFTFTDEALKTFDAHCKLNPPLRSADHVARCLEGLVDGTIDVIASGHAPHAREKKMRELDLAPFGMVSLETTLSLVIDRLIGPGHLDWLSAVAKMSTHPARILGLQTKGHLAAGADADITIIDPDVRWTVDPQQFRSKSSNSPLGGYALRGRAEYVIVQGDIQFSPSAPSRAHGHSH